MNRNLAIFLNFGRISGYWRSLKQKHFDFRTLNFFLFRFLAIINFFVSLSGYYIASRKNVGQDTGVVSFWVQRRRVLQ